MDVRTKGKAVTLLELFYDLVFVFAISRLTGLLEATQEAGMTLDGAFRYVLASFLILQAWLYQTNYNNRFYTGRWYENGVLAVNMMAAIVLANMIGTDWRMADLYFDVMMLVVMAGISVLYRVYARRGTDYCREAGRFGYVTAGFAAVYAVAAILHLTPVSHLIPAGITAVTIVLGAVCSVFVRPDFTTEMVDFHHLTERFELLTIATFGEMIVGVAAYFEAGAIDEISIGAFIVILLLFGCYVMHNHYMIDRHAETHGIVLMYSHYAIVMSLNVVTACQARLPHSGETEAAVALTMVGATLLYFGAVFLNAVYYGRKLWRPGEKGLAAAVLLAGAAIVLILRSGRACLAGMLVMSGGLMILLLWKAHAARITCHECEEEEAAA